MSTYGIICELNPLHNGHARLFGIARERGADRVIAVMSGNAVQRGELAFADKYLRAEAALSAGADLVLELPFPWSSASAEHFARAGVYILSHFADTVIFGSESGDIARLSGAAECAAEESFRLRYLEACRAGGESAACWLSMLRGAGYGELGSNDMLGIEYIKAGIRMGAKLDFCTVAREGADFCCESLGEDLCPSATALRFSWKHGEVEGLDKYMPKEALEIYRRGDAEGKLADIENIGRGMLLALRMLEPSSLGDICDADGGIANRIVTLANESCTAGEFFERLYTKRYTDAKLRRAVLFCLCGVTQSLVFDMPLYTTVLGANAKGRKILSEYRKKDGIALLTKPSYAPKESLQFMAGNRLEALFSLARTAAEPTGAALTRTAVIV